MVFNEKEENDSDNFSQLNNDKDDKLDDPLDDVCHWIGKMKKHEEEN